MLQNDTPIHNKIILMCVVLNFVTRLFMESQKGIEFPKRYRVAKIVYRVALKQQNDTENRGKTSRVLHFQKYHIEMTQNNMSRIYNKNNLSRISH